MRVPASPLACAAVLAAAGHVILATACEQGRPRFATIDSARVEADVRALLDRWVPSFESRNEAAVRSVLADDDRFVWLEDGEARYPSADAVVAALASFPDGLKFSHDLTSVRIVPISDAAAWAQLATTTEILQGDRTVSEFSGVVLMLVQRDHDGQWRITAAHTSTAKPQLRPSG